MCKPLSHAGRSVSVKVDIFRQLQQSDVILNVTVTVIVTMDVESRHIDCLLWQYSLPSDCSVVIPQDHLKPTCKQCSMMFGI